MDLHRPDVEEDGLRIIEELRAEPEMHAFPIVLATGAGSELQPLLPRLQSLEVPVLRKPFEISELQSVLEGYEPRRDLRRGAGC